MVVYLAVDLKFFVSICFFESWVLKQFFLSTLKFDWGATIRFPYLPPHPDEDNWSRVAALLWCGTANWQWVFFWGYIWQWDYVTLGWLSSVIWSIFLDHFYAHGDTCLVLAAAKFSVSGLPLLEHILGCRLVHIGNVFMLLLDGWALLYVLGVHPSGRLG